MARHAETLRAVVLDSVYPRDPLPLTQARSFDAALAALFEACHSDEACAATHPDLAAAYREAMDGLAGAPLTVLLPPGLGAPSVELGPPAFKTVIAQALYYRRLVAMLPKVIEAARNRDAAALQPLIGHLAEQYLTQSRGGSLAVKCRDRPSLQRQDGFADLLQASPAPQSGGICRDWSEPGDPPVIPRSTSIPSLLLSGVDDPGTPPAFARMAAATMGPSARLIEIPHVGHDVEEMSPCGAGLVTQFMRRPEIPVDASCIAQAPSVKFR
ncbi:MAG: alpha/beta hydrolase [Alphaproteobacteria bacterium]|nr:alpha/beta hydrolase [Alphaproteobacteria bacterium]